ncbi:MAG: IS4 family transposase [Thiohalocapsa sp.]
MAPHSSFALVGPKCDGEPGMQTLWLGLQRVRDFVEGLRFAQSLQTT